MQTDEICCLRTLNIGLLSYNNYSNLDRRNNYSNLDRRNNYSNLDRRIVVFYVRLSVH
jgi:hypothetical protein